MYEILQKIDSFQIDRNCAVVYDIDDTLIDSNRQPKEEIIYTYNYALSKGLVPFLVTARRGTEEIISSTHEELQRNGINNYRGIYFLSPDLYKKTKTLFELEETIKLYKLFSRKDITENGYKVLLSIGDKPWDIGKYGGEGVIIQS